SDAGPPRSAAKLYLAEARSRSGLSRAPALPGVLVPQHRGQAPFGEGRAGAISRPRPVSPRKRIAAPALASGPRDNAATDRVSAANAGARHGRPGGDRAFAGARSARRGIGVRFGVDRGFAAGPAAP